MLACFMLCTLRKNFLFSNKSSVRKIYQITKLTTNKNEFYDKSPQKEIDLSGLSFNILYRCDILFVRKDLIMKDLSLLHRLDRVLELCTYVRDYDRRTSLWSVIVGRTERIS